MSGSMNYESDHDPLAYMTADYPSAYLPESAMNMERRFFLRGKSAPHLWQRILVRLLLAIPFGIIASGLVTGLVYLIFRLTR